MENKLSFADFVIGVLWVHLLVYSCIYSMYKYLLVKLYISIYKLQLVFFSHQDIVCTREKEYKWRKIIAFESESDLC